MTQRSRRIAEWVRHTLVRGQCRASSKCENGVADTSEGKYCLLHYMELEDCDRCGEGSTQSTDAGERLCAMCEDIVDMTGVTLVRSSLYNHEEVSGHDTLGKGIVSRMKQ